MRKISVKAEGFRVGAPTRVCVNLVRDTGMGDGLMMRPELTLSSQEHGENGAAVRREPGMWPPVVWRAVAQGELWQPLERFTAKDADMGSVAALTQAELRRYSVAAMGAYSALCARAEEAGLYMQPVLVRYRLTDADGVTLYVSQPTVAGLKEGWQCVEPMEADVTPLSQGIEIGETMLRAETFSLEAQLPDYSEWPEVGLVELEVSPMLHPMDGSKDAAVAVRKDHSGNPVAAIGLPGATSWLSDLSVRRAKQVEELPGRCDRMMRTMRRLPAMAGIVTVPPPAAGVYAEWMSETDMAEGVSDAGMRLVRELSSPHGMSARVEGRAGDTVAYGCVTPLPWPGPHPAELIVAHGGDEVETEVVAGVTRVWFGNRMLERHGELTVAAGAVMSLTPAVTYPHPGATRIEVVVIRGEEQILGAVAELRPSADMSRGVWVSPGLHPLALTEREEDAAGESLIMTERSGVVALVSVGKGSNPVAAATVCSGSVKGLIATDRSLGSWDSSRGRLYAVTTDGVLGLTVSALRREIAAMMLAPQTVNGAAVCGGTIYAAGNRGMMRLAGATLSLVARTPKSVTDIWGVGESGLLMMTLVGGEVRAMDTDGVMTTVAEPREEIEWEATVMAHPGERLTEAVVSMVAKQFRGVVEICGSGPGGRVTLVSLTIDGAVERPLLMRRISAPHRTRLTVRIAGRASAVHITGAELRVVSDER